MNENPIHCKDNNNNNKSFKQPMIHPQFSYNYNFAFLENVSESMRDEWL